MPSLNKVMLMGNLTREPELKPVNDSHVCEFGLALNRVYYAGEEKREEVTFVDCQAWGKTAENIHKYVSKGDPLFVEGRLKLETWEKDGEKKSRMRVVVETFQFLKSGGAKTGTTTPDPSDSAPDAEIPF